MTSGRAPLWLLIGALALLLVALARPTANLERDFFNYLFVFDITQSMNVEDAGPGGAQSRLSFAKQTVRESLAELPCGSRAGLAIFTEHRSFLLFAPVEICEHYGELADMLSVIDWQMAWAARSEVAKGLFSGLVVTRVFGPDAHIVFLTDGHEAPPVNPKFRPQLDKTEPGEVTGLIVGVGGRSPVPIPRLDEDNNIVGYFSASEVMQVDTFSMGRTAGSAEGETMAGVDTSDLAARIKAGTEHLSFLHEQYLENLAQQTRLQYFRLDNGAGLASRLKSPDFAAPKTAETDLRGLIGLIALVLLILAYTANAFMQQIGSWQLLRK